MAVILDQRTGQVEDQRNGTILDQATPAALPGSLYPITLLVELLINGTWVNISGYVYQRNDISITGGRPKRGERPVPSQMTITLNNRDGSFSPLYAGGQFYPYLKRNTQIRITATATSVTGAFFSGKRFWGEVPEWPPMSDPSGKDVWVDITAIGPFGRVRAGGGKGSALTRYYARLTGAYAPIAYWPCEEDPDTTVIGSFLDGGQDMTVTTGTPKWKAISNFKGSAPLPVINNSTWDGLTGSVGQAGASGDDLFVNAGSFSWVAPGGVTAVNVIAIGGGGGGGWTANAAGGSGGGGGGELAQDTAVVVTPGTTYSPVVGAGGQAGADGSVGSVDGSDSTFAGDAVTVRGHGGSRGTSSTAGTGGTGSTNAVHHNGGAGFQAASQDGGGGASGGTAAAGTSAGGRTGGAAVTGGGVGGDGGTPTGGGGGGGLNNFTKTYTATHTYSYSGSDGSSPNSLLSTDGPCTQGGDLADTANGHCKSFILFNYNQIQSDLAGATITSVKVKLNNNHSWFNNGMTVALGTTTATSFGSTHADPSGTNIDLIEYFQSEGVTLTKDVTGAGIGTNFQSGGATCLLLYKNTNDLHYYGYFAGANQSGPPQLIIAYSK